MTNNLKELRKERGLTQQQIADDMDVSKDTYRTWESGRVELNAPRLIQLSKYFGCTVDEILSSKSQYDTMLNQIVDSYRDMDERGKAKLFSASVELHYEFAIEDDIDEGTTND